MIIKNNLLLNCLSLSCSAANIESIELAAETNKQKKTQHNLNHCFASRNLFIQSDILLSMDREPTKCIGNLFSGLQEMMQTMQKM